jgi:hypothetical protein
LGGDWEGTEIEETEGTEIEETEGTETTGSARSNGGNGDETEEYCRN